MAGDEGEKAKGEEAYVALAGLSIGLLLVTPAVAGILGLAVRVFRWAAGI